MDLLSGIPFWPRRDGLPAVHGLLEHDVRCEVAVVGAGISGALVAWALGQAGLDVVVLDARAVGQGSTAGSTALLQYELDAPLEQLAERIGLERARRCYWRCRDAIGLVEAAARATGTACGFGRKRSLLLASRRDHVARLRREFDARRAAGLAVEWWPRREVAARSSLPHPAAILAQEAAQVDAYRLAHGLLAAAARRGVRVHERTQVMRPRWRGRGVELRTNRGARVRARHLVLATGFEAEELLGRKVTALHSTFALASEPLAAWPGWPAERCLIWETARPYVYLRTTEDGRAIIGGYDEPYRDPRARERLLAAKTAALKRRFRQLFPAIPLEVMTAWAGTFANSPDGLPYIGRHEEVPHVWFALGYGGNGITFSALAAELIRDGILGRANPDAELFGFARPR